MLFESHVWQGRREIPLREASEVVYGPLSARIAPFPTSPGPKLGANRAHTRARLPTSSSAPWVARSSREAIPPARHFATASWQRDPGEHRRGACQAGLRDNRTGDPPDDGAVGWALHETFSLCPTLGLLPVGTA